MDTPIAITGLGMVTAQGLGVDATWQGALAAREVLRPWSEAPPDHPLASLKVAQCPPLPRPLDLPPRLWKTLSRTQQLACLAADEALLHARLPRKLDAPGSTVNAGLFLATTVCGMDQNERYYAQYRHDPDTADPALMRRLQPYEVADLLARRHRLSPDPSLREVCMTTCVGSAMAIGNAADAIAQGECDLAIAGGAEALCRVVLSGFHSLKVVAPEGCRPFDLHRPGMTVGEGAGILILESLDHARARGVRPLALLRGFGVTCDAHHLTAPDPAANQPARAIRDALTRAALQPSAIGYINAHGTGTRDNDAMEFQAFSQVFGPSSIPPVSSTKRATGHTFAAAAAIESIFCIQALRTRTLPPNAGTHTPDPALPLPLIRTAQPSPEIRAALCTNFAFGGNNTALLFSASD
jgi:3-oxoacyl-[acyl-carrier-protein] synthase II